ncbi:MAG TPA: lysylphosphatidylglycerol synthase transmembrane domain-containing protein [Acidobacteriaceae bacterium]|nr:lysylphosphatidylglycerol synthase transmembrane domain-containing protein [Acidobacteriaceae bacterium]
MKSRKGLVLLALGLILAAIVYLNRGRIHFDWAVFWLQLRHIFWPHIVAGVALIYATYWLRSARWAVFLSATKKVSPFALVGPQFIGFTAVALIGRLADITRPALVAKKVGLPVSSQLAVYTIERMFDLGAAALIFSSALLFVPRDLPHHEVFVHTGLFSLAGTAAIAIFAVVLRVAGEGVARIAHGMLHPLSASIADSVATKIRGFRDGLNAISSAQDFVVTALISLAMWALIGMAYVETLHAFVETPQLATIPFSRTMLLMAASIGGSLLQLPIIGWFTQIAVTAAAMNAFYGAPIEAATACGALLLFVTFLSIIPAGLIAARLNHVSLRQTAAEAEAVEATTASDASTN